MKWVVNLAYEVELKCRWCPSFDFTHIPAQAKWVCDGCKREYAEDRLLKETKRC